MAQFVTDRAGVSVGNEAINSLHQRTDGNPLFVGEVVSSVSPEEIGRSEDWIASIPEAVRETILRRLSQLSEPTNLLLRTASVIGRDFDLALVRSVVTGISEDEILSRIDEALGIHIIERLPTGLGQYRFRHALMHQAVYEEIPAMRKAQAHAGIAEAIEQSHLSNLEEYAGELAYHYAQAQTVLGSEKLVRFSLMAGQLSLAAYAHEEALVLFQQGLSSKGDTSVDADSAALMFGLGRAQLATLPRSDLHQAHDNFSRAFDYYESVGDLANVVSIAELPTPQLSVSGERSGQLVERALKLVPDDSLEAGRLHSVHGNVQALRRGDYEGAVESSERALVIARRERDSGLEMRTLNYSAQADLWHNNFKGSIESGLVAVDLAVTSSDFRVEISARYWTSISARSLGDLPEVLRQASAIQAPAERLRDRYWLSTAHGIVAWAAALQGHWNLAREANQRSLDVSPSDPRGLMQRVLLETQAGNQQEAGSYLERLEVVVGNSDSGPTTANTCLAISSPVVASTFGSVSRPDLAKASIDAVLSSDLATPFFSTWAMIGAALLTALDDDSEAAVDQYSALKPLAGIMVQFTSVDRVLGLLAECMRDSTVAIAHFENAQTFSRDSGNRYDLV